MALQAPQINTTQLKKAYEGFQTNVSNLNKQVRNHNIKTVLKITLLATTFFASSMILAFGLFSASSLVFPLATFAFKVIATSSATLGILTLFATTLGNKILINLSKTQKQFIEKINKDLKKTFNGNSFYIIKSIFSKVIHQDSSHQIFFSKAFEKGFFYLVQKVKLDSYQKVETRYKKYQAVMQSLRELSQRRRAQEAESSQTERSTQSSFFRMPSFFSGR